MVGGVDEFHANSNIIHDFKGVSSVILTNLVVNVANLIIDGVFMFVEPVKLVFCIGILSSNFGFCI